MSLEVSVVKALSDETTLCLFKNVYLRDGENSDGFMKELGLTKKQFYSKIKILLDLGLVTRLQKQYFPSSFGKVIYHAIISLNAALDEHVTLRVIDKINMAEIPKEKQDEILGQLVHSQHLRRLISNGAL